MMEILNKIRIALLIVSIVTAIAAIILAIISLNDYKDKYIEQIETAQTEIEDLKSKLEELQSTVNENSTISKEEAAEVTGPKDYSNIGTDIDLKECPLCHSSNVVLLAHSKEFYIRCEDCWLFTTDWDSKDDLISYWNGR